MHKSRTEMIAPMAIRVLLVDDQVIIRQGVKTILNREADIRVVGEADNGSQAVEQTAASNPDLVLMDIVMPGSNGIAATRAIKESHPQSQVLILTAHADQEIFRRAAEAGAAGYVLKDIAPEHLIAAIRAVHSGRTMISPVISKQMLAYFFAMRNDRHISTTARVCGLTLRDLDVLRGLVDGLSDKEIAAKLFLSASTIKTHLRAIYRRLKVRNRAQAVGVAVEKKLLII